MKILIDSGATQSLINSGPAYSFFSKFMFNHNFSVTSLNQIITNNKAIEFPILREYGIDDSIQLLVVDWHRKFDALLGHADLERMNAKLDYKNKILKIKDVKIPFQILNLQTNQIFNINVNNDLRIDHLNSEEKESITTLCKKFSDIFYSENVDLSFTNTVKHTIRTKDDEPVYTKSYRHPYAMKPEIRNQIEKLINNRIIRPSISPYSSPVWLVPKKIDASGKPKYRMVIDYRALNNKTIEDKFPLPRIDEILDSLGKCCYFTTLDLAQGFHQIEMDPGSIEKTAFTVDQGHYEYVRMPFGLKNAPSTFQRMMETLLRNCIYKFCFVYMDDVVIFSKSLQEHLIHIKTIFEIFRNANLKVQLDKSEFLRKEVGFLGHVITPEGIKPNPSKIEAVKKYPIPSSVKEIKAFLGLMGFYRRFIKNFAKIVAPFTKCLKKNAKINTSDSEYIQAFYHCKELLSNAPILSYPDFSKTFQLTTDASNIAVGGVLSQNSKPIGFYSRTLNSAERNYSTIEKELLAIVDCTKHFRPYLFGRHFTIETDHKPLVWLTKLKEPSSRLVRWKLKLGEFDFDIVSKAGKENVVADAFSRIEINNNETNDELDRISVLAQVDATENTLTLDESDEILEQVINAPSDNDTQHTSLENPICDLKITDKSVNCYMNRIIFKVGDLYNSEYTRPFQKHQYKVTIRAGSELQNFTTFINEIDPSKFYCVYFENCELATKFSQLIQHSFNEKLNLIRSNLFCQDVENNNQQYKIIEDYHAANHNGITETLQHLKRKYYWPNMVLKISKIINECETCLLSKYERNPPNVKFSGPLVASRPCQVIHLDKFSFDGSNFLTITDLFSKYAQAYYLESVSGISILNKLRHYCSHHNYPDKIVCDEGTEFKNNVIQEFCGLFKINLHYTTNYNPNSNSPVERLHSTLIEKIRTLKQINKDETKPNLMTSAILCYNQSVHTSTGFTPFTLLYGPYDDLNAHELDLSRTIYEEYNQKRKKEILPFYQEIYRKQLEKGSNRITKQNENLEVVDVIEPQIFIKKQKIRKTDPAYDKLNITKINQNKVEGNRDNTKRPTNINVRKTKRVRKCFLQNNPPGGSDADPGPSNSAN
jgi:hypothetical protein